MFCTKCGKQMPDSSRFCTSCGAEMVVPAAPVEGNTYEQDPVMQEPVLTEEKAFVEEITPAEETPVYEAAPVEETPAFEAVSTEETSACEAEPIGEAMPVEEPVYAPAFEETPAEEALPAEPVEKKSGKKRIVLLAVAAAVVMALFVGMIAVIAAGFSPKAKLYKAAQKSGEELAGLMDNSDDFVAMLENAKGLCEEQEFTLKAGYSVKQEMTGYYKMENTIALQVNASQKDKKMNTEVTLDSAFEYPDYPEYGSSQSYKVEFYADEKEAIYGMPDLLDDSYSLPLKKLGDKLFDSDLGKLLEDELDSETIDALQKLDVNLFADTGWKAFKKAYPDEVKAFTDSLVIEKSKEKIPMADEDIKVYAITWDMKALSDLMVAYQMYTIEETLGEEILSELGDVEAELRDSMEDMEDYEFVVYAGIQKGCLTALHVEGDDGYEKGSLTILLEGKENIWEDIVIYVDEEKVLTGGVEKTGDGFEVVLKVDGEKITIECDDAACELTITVDGEDVVLGYGAENNGCQLSFVQKEEGSEIGFHLELLPMEKIEKPKAAVNLLDLSETELEDLMEKIEDSLY